MASPDSLRMPEGDAWGELDCPKDVIVVHVARTLAEGTPLREAAAGDWRVADSAAVSLAYLVAVTHGNEVLGVFDIVGYCPVGKDEDGAQRVRFDLQPSERQVIAEIDRVVQGDIRMHAVGLLSGGHSRLKAPMPSPEVASEPLVLVCADCNLQHAGECW